MSKKINTTKATPPRLTDIPAEFTMEVPEYSNTQSVAIIGSKSRAIGYGVMPSTGKDGKTKTWIISLLVIKSNGKGKLSSLQDTVQNLNAGEAKGYNAYTKDFPSEIDALRACVKCAEEFGGYVLNKEQEKVNAAKSAGKWEVVKKKEDKKKVSPYDFGVTLAEKITSKFSGDEKWACFKSLYIEVIGDNDKLGLAADVIDTLRIAVSVDYEKVDEIITKAIADIRAAELETVKK